MHHGWNNSCNNVMKVCKMDKIHTFCTFCVAAFISSFYAFGVILNLGPLCFGRLFGL